MKNILDKINRADEIQAKLELDKTELAKHEVELALVDDLKKRYSDAKKLANEIEGALISFTGQKNAIEDKSARYINEVTMLEIIIEKIQKQAKEIGLDVNSIGEIKLANELNNQLNVDKLKALVIPMSKLNTKI